MKGRRALPTLFGIYWAKKPRQRLTSTPNISRFYEMKSIFGRHVNGKGIW